MGKHGVSSCEDLPKHKGGEKDDAEDHGNQDMSTSPTVLLKSQQLRGLQKGEFGNLPGNRPTECQQGKG